MPYGQRLLTVDPATKLPPVELTTPPPGGSRQLLSRLGPHLFAQRVAVIAHKRRIGAGNQEDTVDPI